MVFLPNMSPAKTNVLLGIMISDMIELTTVNKIYKRIKKDKSETAKYKCMVKKC